MNQQTAPLGQQYDNAPFSKFRSQALSVKTAVNLIGKHKQNYITVTPNYNPRSGGGIIFSSVRLYVCLFVCQHDNS